MSRRKGAAGGVLLAIALIGILAPILANDRPLLARVDGRLSAPALAGLPIVGALFDGSDDVTPVRPDSVGVPSAGGRSRVLLMPPIPYSYRGIRLDESLRPPSRAHWLGTDALGRDLLARLVHGTRISFLVGFGATALALLIGGSLGAAAGLRGGLPDLLIVRCLDVVACFPPFVLALACIAALGRSGVWPMIAGIGLSRFTTVARYVRGEVLRHKGGEIWNGARAAGASGFRLATRHLLPLLAAPLAVMVSFGVANAILLESGLSFLGFGVDPPSPSWGAILSEARATLDTAWWPVCFPSLALLLVLASLCSAAESAAGEDRSQG